MFCRKCGQKMENGEKFCSKCGTAVKAAVPIENETAVRPEAFMPDRQNGNLQMAHNLSYGAKSFQQTNGYGGYNAQNAAPQKIYPGGGYAPQQNGYYGYSGVNSGQVCADHAPPMPVEYAVRKDRNGVKRLIWYKIFTKGGIVLTMLCLLFWSFLIFTGYQYGIGVDMDGISVSRIDMAEQFYNKYADFRTLDICYAAITVMTAVMFILVWIMLLRFRKSGPALLTAANVIADISAAAYAVIFLVVSDGYGINSLQHVLTIYPAAFAVLLLFTILNAVYFRKRKRLFVN